MALGKLGLVRQACSHDFGKLQFAPVGKCFALATDALSYGESRYSTWGGTTG